MVSSREEKRGHSGCPNTSEVACRSTRRNSEFKGCHRLTSSGISLHIVSTQYCMHCFLYPYSLLFVIHQTLYAVIGHLENTNNMSRFLLDHLLNSEGLRAPFCCIQMTLNRSVHNTKAGNCSIFSNMLKVI